MKTAQEWLASKQDYATGVALFNTLSNNRNLKRYFSRPENTARKNKLKYELEKIAKTQGTVEPPKTKRQPVQPTTPPNSASAPQEQPNTLRVFDGVEKHAKSMLPKVSFEQLPADLKGMYTNTVEMQHKRRMLHDSLFDIAESTKRAEVAKEIDEYTNEINANWQVLMAYQTTGKTPKRKPTAQPNSFDGLTPVQLQKKLTNERTSKSKAKKRIEQYNKELSATKDPKQKKKVEAKIKRSQKTLAEKTANVELLEKLVNG